MSISRETLQRYLDVHNAAIDAGDFAALVQLFAPDGELHFVGIDFGPFAGRDAIAAAFRERPPINKLALTSVTADGNKATAEAQRRLAQTDLSDAKRQVRIEVVQATRAVDVAKANLGVSEKSREIARQSARLSRIAFAAGQGSSFDLVDSARRLREAGLTHSVMVLLGVGGRELSAQHAENTAKVLTAMDPPYVGALTTTVVPGTPLADTEAAGAFILPGKFQMLQELRTIVAGSDFSACRFSANHASNYLPIRADLPEHKQELLRVLDTVLTKQDEGLLKPEWMRGL